MPPARWSSAGSMGAPVMPARAVSPRRSKVQVADDRAVPSRWAVERATRDAKGAPGVDYGEAFRQHRGHPYPHDNRLLNLVANGP